MDDEGRSPVRSDANAKQLPGRLEDNINERCLLHGTRPEHVLNLLQNGLNERMSKSSGAFGGGLYLAEDIEKIDQYCSPDPGFEHPGISPSYDSEQMAVITQFLEKYCVSGEHVGLTYLFGNVWY